MEEKSNQICVQGYKFATMRNNFSIMAQRALLQVVKQMQYRLQNQNLDNLNFDNEKDRKQLVFYMKASDLISNKSYNYDYVKNELEKVIQATIEYEKKENELWGTSVLFTDIIYTHGEIKIRINDTIWNLFVDYSKGYKRFQLATAMLLNTSNSLRLYEILNENIEPITYEIEWLKKLFKVEDKYKDSKDFVKRIIAPAIKEINEKSEINIDITNEFKSNGRGRPKLFAITFTTTRKLEPNQQENTTNEIQRKYGYNILSTEIINLLQNIYGFSENEIKANSELLLNCAEFMKYGEGLQAFLTRKFIQSRQARNPKGWIIGTLKSEYMKYLQNKKRK